MKLEPDLPCGMSDFLCLQAKDEPHIRATLYERKRTVNDKLLLFLSHRASAQGQR
jgi:hypothetical protein